MRAITAAIAFFALLLAALSPGSVAAQQEQPLGLQGVHPAWQDYRAQFTPGPCPFDEAYDPEIISCGSVLVPEDRRDPQSKLIRIAVLRVSALPGAPQDQAIVRLQGGPGSPFLVGGLARSLSSGSADDWRALGEIIYFDQRGIGASDRRFCRGLPDFYQFGGIPSEEGLALALAARDQCLAQAEAEGIPLSAYSNWQNALDVRDLRRALGYESWNLFGISYGSQLALGVMMVDPQGVRAAVIDSIVPTTATRNRSGPSGRNLEQSLEAVAAACTADARCAAAYPDLAERFYTAIDDYGRDPLVLEGLDGAVFTDGQVFVDEKVVAGLLFLLLYQNELYGDLPLLLHALETRDAPALRAYAESGARPADFRDGRGMNAAINCSAQLPWSEEEEAAALAANPRSHGWFTLNIADCTGPLALPLEPTARPIVSQIPTLVATGRADPVTPFQDGAALMSGLANGQYVEFPYTGHGALRSNGDCGDGILEAFIRNPQQPVDDSCVADLPPPDFVTDWRKTGATYPLVSQYQHGALPIVPGLLLALTLGGVLFYPAAMLGRALDRRRHSAPASGLAAARLASWLGATASLGGIALAAWLVSSWISAHPLGLPVGVPSSVIWAGLLATAGALLAAFGMWRAWAQRKTAPVGTLAATLLTLLTCLAVLAFMTMAGLGPVAL